MENVNRVTDENSIEQALQRLLPYVKFLFQQWDKAVGTWPETDFRRQHLKYFAEQVLRLFGQRYKTTLEDPKQTLLSAETQRQLDRVLRAYEKYNQTLAQTSSMLEQIFEDTAILRNPGILPRALHPGADIQAEQMWHEEVTNDERLFLYKSGQYTGYFIGHNEASDPAKRAQRAHYWQQIGDRLVHAGHWEQALRWVMGAFLAERPQSTT